MQYNFRNSNRLQVILFRRSEQLKRRRFRRQGQRLRFADRRCPLTFRSVGIPTERRLTKTEQALRQCFFFIHISLLVNPLSSFISVF